MQQNQDPKKFFKAIRAIAQRQEDAFNTAVRQLGISRDPARDFRERHALSSKLDEVLSAYGESTTLNKVVKKAENDLARYNRACSRFLESQTQPGFPNAEQEIQRLKDSFPVNSEIERLREEYRELLARPGRPRTSDEPIVSYNIGLRQSDLDVARRLGNGNISAGVRIALDRAKTIE